MNGATASRIVLLGGGHAHALTLLMWARSRLAGLEVVLVSPQPEAFSRPGAGLAGWAH